MDLLLYSAHTSSLASSSTSMAAFVEAESNTPTPPVLCGQLQTAAVGQTRPGSRDPPRSPVFPETVEEPCSHQAQGATPLPGSRRAENKGLPLLKPDTHEVKSLIS